MSKKIINFVLLILFVLFVNSGYCLNPDKLKANFLAGDYKAAILEGEKILSKAGHSSGLDELYYLLGLSYLKDGNYLRASDIFEIILKEFKDSPFKDRAILGLGDTYYLRGNYAQAKAYYQKLSGNSKLAQSVNYRLKQCGFKEGQIGAAVYTVQIGSFSNPVNASNLSKKLIKQGYDSYIEETNKGEDKIYRVRVGKLESRLEAVQIEKKLSSEGYPTKIYP